MKGQMGLMEYIILTFFIIIIIIVLVFFLMGYQISQTVLEKRQASFDRALFLTKQVQNSPLFTKSEGILDDAKLTSLKTLGNICPELEELFGEDWYFEITVMDPETVSPAETIPCDQSTYPDCNYWSFCTQDANSITYDLPINIHRNIGKIVSSGVLPRTDIGMLKVGVYVE